MVKIKRVFQSQIKAQFQQVNTVTTVGDVPTVHAHDTPCCNLGNALVFSWTKVPEGCVVDLVSTNDFSCHNQQLRYNIEMWTKLVQYHHIRNIYYCPRIKTYNFAILYCLVLVCFILLPGKIKFYYVIYYLRVWYNYNYAFTETGKPSNSTACTTVLFKEATEIK